MIFCVGRKIQNEKQILLDKLEFVGTNEVNTMDKKINSCISFYKEQVNKSDIQKA